MKENEISVIEPEAFLGVKSLQKLYLYSNQVGRFQRSNTSTSAILEWESLNNLIEFNLRNNTITRIEKNMFSSSSILKLDQSDNQISFIEDEVFDKFDTI